MLTSKLRKFLRDLMIPVQISRRMQRKLHITALKVTVTSVHSKSRER
jgi:hypothetical protein